MSKVAPEIPLDPSQLPETTSLPETSAPPPRELPKHLADFKEYVDSKFCYYSAPVDQAELINVQSKVAYHCQMKVLVESRDISWRETPHTWGNETVLGSSTLGRLFESTVREGAGLGNIWDDYEFAIPSTDKKSKQSRNLPEGNYLTRCTECRGKCSVRCTYLDCNGDGTIQSNTRICSKCGGTGVMRCPRCRGYGGFLHSPTLIVKWKTRQSTCCIQNSYLPEKKIRKGGRTLYWSRKIVPWSKGSSIGNVVESITDDTPNIDLRTDLMKHYNEKHLNPIRDKNNAMRRLECIVERMNFEEIAYTMGDNFINKRDPERGSSFRFCQYPGPKGHQVIYENDYPLNCCGCFGEKLACYSCCCNIL